jgi:uncharacterized protein YndB with AHSA1/START domain
MLAWIVAILVAAILAVLGLAASKPSSFKVAREAQIKAPPARVAALISDFHEWPKWSPWEKMDPAMTRTHSGSASGKGAIYAWSGNKKVGQGRMEILEASPSQVDIDLQFMAPWKAHNKTVFTLAPKDGGTAVNWTMSGSSPLMFKLMGLFMNMDAMIGKDFEAGLANMKQVAESPLLTKQ